MAKTLPILVACASLVWIPLFASFDAHGAPVTAFGIEGRGNPGQIDNYDVTLSATKFPDGTVRGQYSLCTLPQFCANGPVDVVVPPSPGRDYWCASGPRSDAPGNQFTLFLRNVGDGVTSFDRWAGIGSATSACSQNVLPTNPFSTGDFKEFTVAVG